MLARTPNDLTLHEPHIDHRAGAFARAQRHSRRVRILKWILPGLAMLLAGAFLVQSWRASPGTAEFDTQDQSITDGKLVMANPKLDGFTKENFPYSMVAARAVQDVTRQGVVELEGIDAKLPINATDWADIVASRGVFDRASNTLKVDSRITVRTSDGVSATLQSADIDMGAGDMRTDKPVSIEFKGSTIESQTMSVAEGGKLVTFENKVRVKIVPAKAGGTKVEGQSDAVE